MKQEENALSLRFDKSFQAKMRQIDEPSKSYYQAIKNHALSYKGTRARIHWLDMSKDPAAEAAGLIEAFISP